MIHIAIVEDEDSPANALQNVLDTYAKENGETFDVKRYTDAYDFLAECNKSYDIVFLDIELPGMNGMDAAFKLRALDRQVVIIFVTNMAQYAVRGYEVDALYYIIKPISYQSAAHKLKKALSIAASNTGGEIVITQPSGIVRLSTKDLSYVEVTGHKLIYHSDTESYVCYGSLSAVEETLKKHDFFRCNSCYLVNAKHIASISGHTLILIGGSQLQISHPKKKQFMLEIANWLGDGNI